MPLLQDTAIPGVAMWSRWQADRRLNFNSFFVRGEENVIIDPLAIDGDDLATLRERGGAAWIVLTTRDHERESRVLAAALGAKVAAPALDVAEMGGPVDRELHPGDEIAGFRTVGLPGMKSPGEFALHHAGLKTIVAGDALWGDPPGAVRMVDDAKLGDPQKALGSLRRLWALRPDHLLVGDGACIFGNATAAIAAYRARPDFCAGKINLDEIDWTEYPQDPPPFGGSAAEVGRLIGAFHLGYQGARIPPGKTFCPYHWHPEEEELFFVVSGTPTLRTPQGEYRCRPGDCIAFPVGPVGAHLVRNDSDADCTILMIANEEQSGYCIYPDSNKVLLWPHDAIVRLEPRLDYYDGEL